TVARVIRPARTAPELTKRRTGSFVEMMVSVKTESDGVFSECFGMIYGRFGLLIVAVEVEAGCHVEARRPFECYSSSPSMSKQVVDACRLLRPKATTDLAFGVSSSAGLSDSVDDDGGGEVIRVTEEARTPATGCAVVRDPNCNDPERMSFLVPGTDYSRNDSTILQWPCLDFVGGLDPSVSDEALRQVFGQFGEIVHVKIPAGKRCGFVQFADRASFINHSILNGTKLGGQSVRLSWGRSPSSKQGQPDQAQYDGGGGGGPYYGYAQGYEAYGYAPPPQDPNAYYGVYAGAGGYGGYQQPQQ
ncbi:hypothetical protein M8C21_027946, partial [Ambrosia artemisiifolia]